MVRQGAQHSGQFMDVCPAAAELGWNGRFDQPRGFQRGIIVGYKAIGFIGEFGPCGKILSQRFGAGYEVEGFGFSRFHFGNGVHGALLVRFYAPIVPLGRFCL